MKDVDVVIAGGGIGGLTLALTLHQIGVSCVVLETARAMRPLGVGINIQPNAVRELFALDIGADLLDQVGLPVQEWALLGLNGKEVYAEPRGTFAGYNWPQYAVHRGNLHMLLYHQVIERMGPDAVKLGARALGYDRSNPKQPVCHVQTGDGQEQSYKCTLLIGADGIHSAIRSQMHPDQAPIHWGGAIMWRGTLRAKPMRSPSSFIGLGTH
ncbi:MAG: FAD-dependent monooxygenase, partial [Planktomarina temperata]